MPYMSRESLRSITTLTDDSTLSDAAATHGRLLTAHWSDDGAIVAVLPLPLALLGHHGGGWVRTGVRRNGTRYYASQYRIEYANHKHMATRVYWQALKFQRLWWRGATMDVDWCFAGKQPDDDGVIGRLAAYRDAAQEAGIVSDDSTVRIGRLDFVRVPRAYQCVVVRFRIRHEEDESA